VTRDRLAAPGRSRPLRFARVTPDLLAGHAGPTPEVPAGHAGPAPEVSAGHVGPAPEVPAGHVGPTHDLPARHSGPTTDVPPRGPRLMARGRRIELSRPLVMGIVNASPDSFSDGGLHPTLEAQVELARELLASGAGIIDIGGESATTDRPVVDEDVEIGLVVPLVERVVELGGLVSVETYKPRVAAAAIAAGAAIVNDVSGLRHPGLADVCAETGAALVVMHTRSPPRRRLHDPDRYADVLADVLGFLAERIAVARSRGVAFDQLIVDPGPDFSKTPAQTIELLRGAERLHELGRPVLMAVSRKDFVGALTGRPPRERLGGSLAALAHGLDIGARIFRMHDVGPAVDFLTVRAALRGETQLARDAVVGDAIRWEPPAAGGARSE
jgi:dihydropteroate synthase